MSDACDARWMARALELARRGEGHVEPNPMVGCVLARGESLLAEGWHTRFGGPHAEIEALHRAGTAAAGATAYVTLEPCCHFGKTPPCTQALRAAGVARVVVAQRDPFPAVSGRGIAELQQAGIGVEVGLGAEAAQALNAPYLHLLQQGTPWVLAKWAMTLDGKLATRTGDSRWISNATSRERVHQLRGRVDAVMVGRGTAERDDPLLTARPPGPRRATRIVLDSQAALSPHSQLIRTVDEAPVLVAAGPGAPADNCARLRAAGCEVLVCEGHSYAERLGQLLAELGRRRMTNVLVEGGGQLLGSLWDARQIHELHIFIASRLVGGAGAPSPLAGLGVARLGEAGDFGESQVELLAGDIYIQGRRRRTPEM